MAHKQLQTETGGSYGHMEGEWGGEGEGEWGGKGREGGGCSEG